MVAEEKYDLWKKKVGILFKNIAAALLVSMVIEMFSLLFTDNRIYGSGGSVIAMRIINWFRVGVWFTILLFFLYRWKNMRDFFSYCLKQADGKFICRTFCLETGLFFSGFMMMKFLKVKIFRYHNIFLLCFSLFLITVFCYYRKKIQKVETLFLITALLFSACYILTAPVFVTGGDQGIHFTRTANLAQSYLEVEFDNEYDSYNEESTNVLMEKTDYIIAKANEEPVYSYIYSKPLTFPSLRYISYIPPAAVLAVADALNFSPTAAYFAGQFCNALIYILLIYLGACKLKAGKLTLIAFASMPRMLFLATRYSYTPWVVAWIAYASAYIIGKVQESDKMIKQKDMLIIAASFLLGMLVKAPYFMFVPLALLISKQKFPDLKAYKKYIVLIAGTMLVLLMTLVIPIFVNKKGFDVYSDIRGGAHVDAFEQMKFILTNPLAYTGILLSNIRRLFSFSVFVVGKDGFTGMRAGISGVMPSVMFLLFLWIIITDKKIEADYHSLMKERIFVFGLTAVNICWICTVMYMNYSEVGAAVINGCNPMYLMAFMFPFFYYCRSGHVQSDFNWRRYNTAVYGLLMTIMFITIYVRVIYLYK